MRIPSFLARLLVAGTLAAGTAQAESLSLATTGDGTAIYFYGLAISKTADAVSGLDIRPRPYRSAGQGAVFVDRGEVAFGLFNAVVLKEAYRGEAFYKDRALTNLRLVARLVPFQLTFGARGGSGLESVADLKGKRVPAGFDGTAFGDRLYMAMLATGGIGAEDVELVQVSDWAGLGKAFVRNEIDVNGLVVGSATAKRYADQVEGYHAVSLGSVPDAQERLQAIFPDARLATVAPADGLDGILQPVTVLEYDYWLYAHTDTPDAAVTALLTSLRDGASTLTEISADFRDFDATRMYEDIGLPFHPAALEFYESQSLK